MSLWKFRFVLGMAQFSFLKLSFVLLWSGGVEVLGSGSNVGFFGGGSSSCTAARLHDWSQRAKLMGSDADASHTECKNRVRAGLNLWSHVLHLSWSFGCGSNFLLAQACPKTSLTEPGSWVRDLCHAFSGHGGAVGRDATPWKWMLSVYYRPAASTLPLCSSDKWWESFYVVKRVI